MGQDPSAEHIDDRREIDEATPHRNVGGVHCPRMVGPLDLQSAQQVRVDLVTRSRLARVRATIDRLDPHALHQRRDVAATGVYALPPQQRSQHTRSREGIIEMQLIEPTHQGKVLGRNWPRFIVDRAASQLQDLRLAHDRKIMTAVDHRFALSRPALVSAPDKKSFSNASSPILACNAFKSTGVSADVLSCPNTPAAPSRSWFFQIVIWFG
ncbi:hypothetical protein ABIF33_000149 [Bradyrhizobium elkanii]